MFVEVGTQVSVENLIQGLIVQSGNDATVALAEHVAGSEPVFVDLMNQYAQQLGHREHALPERPGMPSPEHYTTARDIARAVGRADPRLSRVLQVVLAALSSPGTRSRSRIATACSIAIPTVDGLKTGHTEIGRLLPRVVGEARRHAPGSVVMGSPQHLAREDASAALLNYGFNFYQTRKLYGPTRRC